MGAVVPTPDQMTGVNIGIGYEHHEIHEGDMFSAHHEGHLPTNANEETAVAFLTPAAPVHVHLIVSASANDESTFQIREDPTITLNQGTTQAPINRNRDSTNTSGMIDRELVATGAISTFNVLEANNANLSGGTLLHSEVLAISGNPPFASMTNTATRDQREWVLAPSTEYVIIVTSDTANLTSHFIDLEWYEHTDSNYVA